MDLSLIVCKEGKVAFTVTTMLGCTITNQALLLLTRGYRFTYILVLILKKSLSLVKMFAFDHEAQAYRLWRWILRSDAVFSRLDLLHVIDTRVGAVILDYFKCWALHLKRTNYGSCSCLNACLTANQTRMSIGRVTEPTFLAIQLDQKKSAFKKPGVHFGSGSYAAQKKGFSLHSGSVEMYDVA